MGAKVVFENTRTRNTGHRYSDNTGKCADFWGAKGTSYRITVEKHGYEFDPSQMTVDPRNKNGYLYFKVKKRAKAKLVIKVLANDGKAVPGVKVDFKNTLTGNTGWRRTDQSGKCDDFWCPIGKEYLITPQSNDYVFTPRTKTIPIGSTTSQIFAFEATRKTSNSGTPNTGSSSSPLHEEGRTKYKITVQTANVSLAGTDSDIKLELKGENGHANIYRLGDRDDKCFERGKNDIFVEQLFDVGNLKSIKVSSNGHHGLDLRGSGSHIGFAPSGGDPGWFLEWITVENVHTEQSWYFPCYRWIYSTQAYGSFDDQSYAKIPKFGDGAKSRVLFGTPITPERGFPVFKYEVTVNTGDVDYAGTDAEVYLVITAGTHVFPFFLLDNKTDNFERRSHDTFILWLPKIHEISRIKLLHSNHGDNAGWFLDDVKITRFGPDRTTREKEWSFTFNQWVENDNKAIWPSSKSVAALSRQTPVTPTPSTVPGTPVQ